jgi:hypothetical protein
MKVGCPLRAKSGLMQCSKQHLYSSNSSARRIAGPSNSAPCRHRHQVTVCFSSSQLDCGSQAFNQRCFVKRLAQKADRPAMERPIAVVLIWIGGNQNYWSAMSLRSQHLLQLKAVEAGHLQVGNQASRFRDHIRPKEMLGRAENNGFVSQGLDEFPYTISGQRVVVHDRDQRVFTSQDCTGSRLRRVSNQQLNRTQESIRKVFDKTQKAGRWFRISNVNICCYFPAYHRLLLSSTKMLLWIKQVISRRPLYVR